MATKYVKGKLYKLAIADLQPDPNQARSFMDPNASMSLPTPSGNSASWSPSSFVKTIRRR
ncbi:MAG: hypothetical protein WCW53_09200 [Syntrophales bacterium]